MSKLNSEKLIKNARKDSIKNPDIMEVDYKDEKYKLSVKHVTAAICVALFLAVYAIWSLGYDAYNAIKQGFESNQIITEAIDVYQDIVADETKRTADREHYFYENGNIAKRALDKIVEGEGDYDVALYGIYTRMGNHPASLNSVISTMGGIVERSPDDYPGVPIFQNMQEYQEARGWVNKDGVADEDSYVKGACKYIKAKNTVDQVQNTNPGAKK